MPDAGFFRKEVDLASVLSVASLRSTDRVGNMVWGHAVEASHKNGRSLHEFGLFSGGVNDEYAFVVALHICRCEEKSHPFG